MLTHQALATIRAALLFWREEMHSEPLMRPYLDPNGPAPLSAREVDELRDALRPEAVRYAVYDPAAERLLDTELFVDGEAAIRAAGGAAQVATVLLIQPR